MRPFPYISFIAAVGVMLTYHWSMSPGLRWTAAAALPFFLGFAAIGWGLNALSSGETVVYNYSASRAKRPFTFWTNVLVFRFAIGVVLIAGGVWHLATS